MNLAYAVKRAPSSESTSLARWVLFPIHDFPLSDFRPAVHARVRIGRSGLLGEFMSRRRKPAEETGNQTLVGSGVASEGLGSSYLDLEFGF